MSKIAVIGTGYVGLVTGTCFADLGNDVSCVDLDEKKIERLKKGHAPMYEPGLEEIIHRNLRAKRLHFTTSYEDALRGAEFVFIAVGTPEAPDGSADMRYVESAARSVGELAPGRAAEPLYIINKSTVPIGTGDVVGKIVREAIQGEMRFVVVSNPEFLREGQAVHDFMNPDRIILGAEDRHAAEQVRSIYEPLAAPVMITDLRTAEMIKYASNAILATYISFINEIAMICEQLGADVKEVVQGMGYDRRINPQFLNAGVGFGGSCFEGDEMVFALNSPNIAAQSLESLFSAGGTPFQGDVVEVVTPLEQSVLAFDLETGQPTLADVRGITRRPYKGTMVSINTSMGRKLRVTADHPVIVHDGPRMKVLPAALVAPGHELLALCELPSVEEPADLDLITLLRGTTLEADVLVSCTSNSFSDQYARFASHVPPEMAKYPHDIKRNNSMSLRLFNHLRSLGLLDVTAENLQLYTAKGAATKINAAIPVDADLMRLCGYYLAEGYLSVESGRGASERTRIGICFSETETEYVEDVQRILRRLGLKFIERRATHAVTTVVSSRIFGWLLRDVLKCGTRSEDKALPRLAFNVSPQLRHELLRGALSGDGAVTPVMGKNLMLEYATVSKALADGMVLLLQTLGVVPSIHMRWMNKSKKPAYILRVSGRTQIEALQWVFGEKRHATIMGHLAGYSRNIRQRGFTRHGSYATLKVQSVAPEEVSTVVYSLETSKGTVIAASGLIAHNCFPKDVKALAYMAENDESGPGHPRLLNAVLDINKEIKLQFVSKVCRMLGGSVEGKKIGVLGLSFKPDTDDMRESPSIDIINSLIKHGATVAAFDPVAMEAAREHFTDVHFCDDAYEVAKDADAVLLVTAWNEFKQLDMERIRDMMRGRVLVDGRNVYDPKEMGALGFSYAGVGR